MSQTVKLLSLSGYECFMLESLHRQVAKEDGHHPGARARKRIRDEYIATLGKKTTEQPLPETYKIRGVTSELARGEMIAGCHPVDSFPDTDYT